MTPTGTRRATGLPTATDLPSANTQLKDLFQKKQTLEHEKQLLTESVHQEKQRGEDAVKAMQAKHAATQATHQKETAGWKDGCDTLVLWYHVALNRLAVQLAEEKARILDVSEALRVQELATLQRDFRITMFQHKERELEAQVAEFQDLLQEQAQEQSDAVNEQIAYWKTTAENYRDEHDTTQESLSALSEQNAVLQAESESKSVKLERLNLQLDGSEAKYLELERKYDDLKQTNSETQRRLDKWESLEKRGGDETETLRRQKIDLGITIKGLETQIDRLNEAQEESKRMLGKERTKVEKLKDTLAAWKSASLEAEQGLETAQNEIEALKLQLDEANAQDEIEALKLQLTEANAQDEIEPGYAELLQPTGKPPRKKLAAAPTAQRSKIFPDISENEEVQEVIPVKAKSKAKKAATAANVEFTRPRITRNKNPKVLGKGKERAIVVDAEEEDQEDEEPQDDIVVVEASEPEPEPVPKPTAKGRKRKAAESEAEGDDKPALKVRKKAAAVDSEAPRVRKKDADSEAEGDNKPAPRARKKAADSEAEGDNKPAPKTRKKPPAAAASGSLAGRRTNTKALPPTQTVPENDDDNDDDGTAKKKKGKKIKLLFPPPQNNGQAGSEFTLNWTSQPNTNGMQIPTVLSPVKATELVPQRGFLGRVSSALTSSFSRP